MSQAFVREGDEQSLGEILPSLKALVIFLTRENNGVRVYERTITKDPTGRLLHNMSNGLTYALDAAGRWAVVE